ncbi:carboxypeptidase-like regulatory domain-containing protein [Peristeroidobacter soli]|uniref:carboxypeptidase-like regulatory domain-containing protein n=1 Tax=Peristeroidobacter soli TaxID=2497877 RepID=UPI00101D6A5C|nr:carboxypeptidase-like regulatory domain-containing protein [Peristeroidobacter soli]
MTGMSDPSLGEGTQRWPLWRWILLVVLGLVAVQSITITLPIRGRVLDEATGKPVVRAAVVALWQLDAYGFEHTPAGAVRMAEALTDEDGVFRIPIAVMIHLPLLPFSPLARSDTSMPELIFVADGYYPESASNVRSWISEREPASGFLSLRTSSLERAEHRLTPVNSERARAQRRNYVGDLGWVSSAIQMAAGTCAKRLFCKGDRLVHTWNALERGGLCMR